jgi:hypothetical protein
VSRPTKEELEKLEMLMDSKLEEGIRQFDEYVTLTRREYVYCRALLRWAYASGIVAAGSDPELLYKLRSMGYSIDAKKIPRGKKKHENS